MSCLTCKNTEVIEPIYEPCILRIFAINDVYLLDNFPRYATARKQEVAGANLTIGTLAGDFLAPSLLSTMDKGVGIVDCMGTSGVDYVCFGNHENDVKFVELKQRIRESKFEWINTNMIDIPFGDDVKPLPKYKIIEVKSSQQKRRIALLGLNSEDPHLYQDGRFGGCVMEPVNATCAKWVKELKAKENVDIVIPMTHQDMDLDRELAEMEVVPLILGGHDHVVYNETIKGCKIIKAGINLENIAIVDVIWNSPTTTNPMINITLKPSSSYSPDPTIEQLAKKHQYVLEQLEKAELFRLPEYHRLSSKNARQEPASMVVYLLTLIKQIMEVDCVMNFTYADLKNEFYFDMNVIVLPLPGSVIAETVEWSRAGSHKSPPESNDPKKIYNVTVNYLTAFKDLDNVKPLVKYVKEQVRAKNPAFLKDLEIAVELKHLLIGHFSKLVLFNMLSADKVLAMDQNHDGLISKEEFRAAARLVHGDDVSDLLVDNLFNIADLDGNGTIDKSEINALLKLAGDHKEPYAIEEAFNSFSAWWTAVTRPATSSNADVNDISSDLIKTMTFDGVSVDDITNLPSTLIKRVSMIGNMDMSLVTDNTAKSDTVVDDKTIMKKVNI